MLRKLLALLIIQIAVFAGVSEHAEASEGSVHDSAIANNVSTNDSAEKYQFKNQNAWLFKNEKLGISIEVPKEYVRNNQSKDPLLLAAMDMKDLAVFVVTCKKNQEMYSSEVLDEKVQSFVDANKNSKELKLILAEVSDIGNIKAAHIVDSSFDKLASIQEYYVRDNYIIFTPVFTYTVQYHMPQSYYEKNKERLGKFVATLKISK